MGPARFALGLIVTALVLVSVPTTAQAAPRLVIGSTFVEAGASPRVVIVRGVLAPARRRVVYHVAYRRVGAQEPAARDGLRGATYHLLYSGGNWQGRYAMGHATSSSPTGPFTRSSQSPWASSTDSVLSMGGGMPIRDGAGDEWLVYHGRAGSLDLPRTLRIDRLSWTAYERPTLDGPSTDIRTAPTP